MIWTINSRRGPLWPEVFALGVMLLLAGCDEPAEEEVRAPEAAEIDVAGSEIEFQAAFPLEPEDINDLMLARGTVVGIPGPAGFFLHVEGNRVVFVESADSVKTGEQIDARGPLQAIDATVFAGWERDLLSDRNPSWLLVRDYYIDATSVQRRP